MPSMEIHEFDFKCVWRFRCTIILLLSAPIMMNILDEICFQSFQIIRSSKSSYNFQQALFINIFCAMVIVLSSRWNHNQKPWNINSQSFQLGKLFEIRNKNIWLICSVNSIEKGQNVVKDEWENKQKNKEFHDSLYKLSVSSSG